MKHGNKIFNIFFVTLFFHNFTLAQDKITSSPLINLDQIKPSFEEPENNEEIISGKKFKNKKERKKLLNHTCCFDRVR